MSNEVKIAITSKADLDAIDRAIAKLKELQNKTVKVKLDIDDDALDRRLKELDKKVKEAGGIELDVDDRKAHRKLDGLIDKHKQLGKDHAEIDLDTKKARGKLTYLVGRIKALSDETVNIDLDTGAALGKIAALKAALKAIPDETINVKADVDVNRSAIQKALGKVLNGDGNQLVKTKLDVNKAHMRSALNDALDFGDKRVKVKIDVDRDYLARGINKAMSDVAGETLTKKIRIDLDREQINKQFNGLSAGKQLVKVRVTVDSSELKALRAELAALTDKTINVRVNRTGGGAGNDVATEKSLKRVSAAAKDASTDIDKYGASTRKAASRANSMQGAMSRMRRSIGDIGRDYSRADRNGRAFTNTLRGLGGAAGGTLRAMGAVGNVMTQAFSMMTRGIPVIGGVVKGLNAMTAGMASAGSTGAGALASFGKVAGPIGAVAVAAGLAAVGLGVISAVGVAGTGALVAGLYATQAALGGIVGVSSLVAGAVGAAIAAPFVYFAAQSEEVKKAFSDVGSYVSTEMKAMSAGVSTALVGTAGKVKESFDVMRPSLERMAEQTRVLVTQLSDKMPAAAAALGPALEKGLATGAKHLNLMADSLPGIATGMGKLFDSLGTPEVMEASQRFWSSVPGMISGAGKAVEVAATGFNNLSEFMSSDQLAPLKDGLAAFGQEIMATDWSPVIDGAREAANAFGTFLSSVDGENITQTISGITGAFTNLTNLATEINLDGMMAGLAQGIEALTAGITNTVKTIKVPFQIAGEFLGIIGTVAGDVWNAFTNLFKDPPTLPTIKPNVEINPNYIVQTSGSLGEIQEKIRAAMAGAEASGMKLAIKVTPEFLMTELTLPPGQSQMPPVVVPATLGELMMPNGNFTAPPVKLQGVLDQILGGPPPAGMPPVVVPGTLGELMMPSGGAGAGIPPVEVPAIIIPKFDENGLKVGEIRVPLVYDPPKGEVPPPPPVKVPTEFGQPSGAPTYTGPPVKIPTALEDLLGPPPPLKPVEQPVIPKFQGLMGGQNLPPIEQPVHAKMDTSGVPTTLPPATQEVIQIKSGFNKEMATKLPPVTQEIIPQLRAMPTIPPLTVQVIPQFAGAAIPNLPPITVPVNFQVGPLNLPQPPAITVTVTSNASEVASQVASIPTSVTTSHSVNTNVSSAIAQISALNGMNTTSTHTVNVVVNGSIPGGGGGAPAPTFAGIPQGISPMSGIAGFGAMSDTGLTGVAQAGGMSSNFNYSSGSGSSLLAISNIVRNSIVDGYSNLGASIGDALIGGIQSKESMISNALTDMTGIIANGLSIGLDLANLLDAMLPNLGIFDILGHNIADRIVGSAGSTLATQSSTIGWLEGFFSNFKLFGFSLSDIFGGWGGINKPRQVASGSLDGTGQMITYNNFQTIQNQFDGGLVGDPERQARRVLDVLETAGAGRRANQILGNGTTTTGGP